MRTVLFFTDIHAGVHATEYIGACERAAALGWRVIEIEYARTGRSAAEFINHWQPDGLIVECGHLIGRPNLRAYGDLPAVFIDPKVSPAQAKSLFLVKQDAAAISAAAYDELAAANPAAYAFVGWAGHQDWSLEREATFHDDACAGLSSADILKSLPSSRRSVEQRFRAAVGHSIGEEIFRIRFEKVLRLLADPRLPIEQIASDCGWESASFLKRTFRRLTGMTMREWRQSRTGSSR